MNTKNLQMVQFLRRHVEQTSHWMDEKFSCIQERCVKALCTCLWIEVHASAQIDGGTQIDYLDRRPSILCNLYRFML